MAGGKEPVRHCTARRGNETRWRQDPHGSVSRRILSGHLSRAHPRREEVRGAQLGEGHSVRPRVRRPAASLVRLVEWRRRGPRERRTPSRSRGVLYCVSPTLREESRLLCEVRRSTETGGARRMKPHSGTEGIMGK